MCQIENSYIKSGDAKKYNGILNKQSIRSALYINRGKGIGNISNNANARHNIPRGHCHLKL